MKIGHVALWTRDLDAAASFWAEHFGAVAGEDYHSRNRPGFRSRWLTLPEGDRVELMTGPWVAPAEPGAEPEGWAHVALSLGSEDAVRQAAEHARVQGCLHSGPRWTGDGYYEAVVLMPDGTPIEVTV